MLSPGSAILLHSKAFDPKVFLSTVHPHATFQDLTTGQPSSRKASPQLLRLFVAGRERLKDSLEQRSGALKQLVQSEWDRFVGVKGATEGQSSRCRFFSVLTLRYTVIYEEMKHGPLADGADHGCKDIKETLRRTSLVDAISHFADPLR